MNPPQASNSKVSLVHDDHRDGNCSKTAMLGTKLRNRYYIVRELGVGGFGQTFLAQDYDFPGQPWCVVKQLKPQVKEPWMLQTARRLFDLEASVLARIGNHPQIPQLKAHFEEDEQFYLVQEFIEGELLSKELKEGSIWSQEQALVFLQDTLDTLHFIHDNQVIHRDLKPENIIRRDSDQKLVLIDFGSVKKITTLHDQEVEDSEITVAIGTPAYMPVEQQGGKPTYNSDIYALGKIVIQGLTGISPKRLNEDAQTGEILWEHLVNLDDFFADVISQMVRWNARDRYQTVAEIINDLSPYLGTLPPPSSTPRSTPKRNPSQIDKIVRNFKHNPEITRIKKLLFCAYKQRWENSPRILSKYRTKFLLQELRKREPSIEDFSQCLNNVVQTLNKKDKYQRVANSIINEVRLLYEISHPLEEDSEVMSSSQVTDIRGGESNQTGSSSGYTNIKASDKAESQISSKKFQEADSENEQSAIAKSSDKLNQEEEGKSCNLFDLRYEVTRYTTPLRIKILLFSMLYYKIDFNEQDWSLIMNYQLDTLLKQIVQTFSNLTELENRLYATARNFNSEEGLTQVVGAVVQALRPFYEKGQPKIVYR